MHIVGTISKKEVKDFLRECYKLGWTITNITSKEVVYLDREDAKACTKDR